MKKSALSLAEVLITMTIMGIIGMVSVPSVINNTQQHEFKTGLRKAVTTLNEAISLGIAVDGRSPYETSDLFGYLTKHMSIIRTTTRLPWHGIYKGWDGKVFDSLNNAAFYTTDGMRFEMDDDRNSCQDLGLRNALKLHETEGHACLAVQNAVNHNGEQINWTPKACTDLGFNRNNTANINNGKQAGVFNENGFPYFVACDGCGSLGLGAQNKRRTTKPPCAILVDVNGDRKPTPSRVYNSVDSWRGEKATDEDYIVSDPKTNRVSDVFTILITEDRAIPYGVVAQRAMYEGKSPSKKR